MKSADSNEDGRVSKMEIFFALSTVYKNQHIRPASPKMSSTSSDSKEYYEPTAQDLQLKKLIDEVFLKYDPGRKLMLGVQELPGFLNECFARLGLPNRVSPQEAQAAFNFIDLNKDGRIQKMEVFILLKQLLTKNQ